MALGATQGIDCEWHFWNTSDRHLARSVARVTNLHILLSLSTCRAIGKHDDDWKTFGERLSSYMYVKKGSIHAEKTVYIVYQTTLCPIPALNQFFTDPLVSLVLCSGCHFHFFHSLLSTHSLETPLMRNVFAFNKNESHIYCIKEKKRGKLWIYESEREECSESVRRGKENRLGGKVLLFHRAERNFKGGGMNDKCYHVQEQIFSHFHAAVECERIRQHSRVQWKWSFSLFHLFASNFPH